MQLVWGAEPHVSAYITARFPELCAHAAYTPDCAAAFVSADGEVLGGVGLELVSIFEGHVSIAADRPGFLSRKILDDLFDFTFNELGLVRLTAHIAKRNRRSRRLVERLGFRLEGVKRAGFDGQKDACVYGLLATDCIWPRRTR